MEKFLNNVIGQFIVIGFFYGFVLIQGELTDCWWTGCQKNDWAVTGCGQYNRTERNRTTCDNGHLYDCCLSCSWTGCEKNDWAKKGCEHLEMTESYRQSCENGFKYVCCPKTEEEKKSCWWTSCQSNNWAVYGCEQYNRIETNKELCNSDAEHKYYCCPPTSSTEVPATTPKPSEVIEQCLWTPCQYANTTNRGCPQEAREIEKGLCPDGETFNCCFSMEIKETNEDPNIEETSGETFEDFVKYLLFKSRNFTVQPDRIPCTLIDPDKKGLLQVKDEALRICDLCPNFPQKRISNVFLDTLPKQTEYNQVFGECFGLCFDMVDCMAFSYDHAESICYIFDNTVGTLKSESGWTTIFMTQPSGILNHWSYVRHTKVQGRFTLNSTEQTFLNCLEKCENTKSCNIVTYSLADKECHLFDNSDDVDFIDLSYGHVSALNIQRFPLGDDDYWRFTEDGDILEETKVLNNEDKCAKNNYNGTHSAYYSKVCLTNQISGCNSQTGCKMCYYPENVEEFVDLPVCPDSESVRKQEIVAKLEKEMKFCLKDDKCVGVGFDKAKQSYTPIKVQSLGKVYDVSYMLSFPKLETGIHQYLSHIELIPNMRISPVQNSKSIYKEIPNVSSDEECILKLKGDNFYTKASYSFEKKLCHLGDNKIEFKNENNNHYVTYFKKPTLSSRLKNFIKVPNANVDISNAFYKYNDCKQNCEEECARKCVKCTYVLIKYLADRTECSYFEDLDDLEPGLSDNTLVLVRTSKLDFSLQSLNELSPFQEHHIYECFSQDNEQTQTSLTTLEDESHVSKRRRKRGFWDKIGKAFKSVGKFIANTVKDTVKTVVDTAKGVVKSVGKVVKGDLKGAKDEFMKIPVVKDVKTAVELGGAVITGDWDKAKSKGIDLLQSSTLDLVTSVIPGGKIIGTAAKAAGKGLKAAQSAGKKAGDKIKRKVDKVVNKVENKNKQVKSDKNKEDTKNIEERGKCEKRSKRSSSKGKGKQPGKCDQNDDDKNCPRPSILHSIAATLADCVDKKSGEVCDYECDVGYSEVDPRIKCNKINDKHVWPADAKCELETCEKTPYPLIRLETPQLPQYYKPGFGKHITAYMVLFDKAKRLPIWSITMQQADFDGRKHGMTKFISKSYNTAKNHKRNDDFLEYPCKALEGHQAGDGDYYGSGWHRGHLTPANVLLWSIKAKRIVNLYINVAPQDQKTNSGPWSKLEKHVECLTEKHPSLVVTGICLDSAKDKTNKGKGVLIPTCYWKLVCYKDEKGKEQVVGFISDNTIVSTKQELADRSKQIFTPVSQVDVKKIMSGAGLIKDPWTMTATHVYKGREVSATNPSSSNAAVWFPVNAFQCSQINDLSDEEKTAWEKAFVRKKKKKSKKKGTTTTTTPSPTEKREIIRGCYDADDPEFYDPDSDVDSDSDGDSDGEIDGSSSSAAQQEAADGVSLVSNISKCNKRIVGYYTSWGKKEIHAGHLKRLTHVIYAFIEMNADGTVTIGSADRETSKDPEKDKEVTLERLHKLLNLAKAFPHLKVMFAVGGWANSQYYSRVAASPDARIRFIGSVIKLIEQYGFDGVDLDWEYPVTGGANEGTPSDKENYVTLMKELRQALDGFASKVNREEKFLISFASAAGQWTLDPGYNLPDLLKYADFANVMTYDFFGAWESKWGAYTGPPAPLFFGMPPRFSGKTNTDWTMKYYSCKTKTPHKINMGVPFYGRFWKNVGDPVDKSDGMWRLAAAVGGKFEGGYVPWNEIESQYLNNGAYEKKFHEKAKAPYAFSASAKTFLGYEDQKSLTFKKNYAVEKNIGGLMIWALELDDDNLSLLKTIADANLCEKTDPSLVNYKCSPIDEKRWWTSEDGDDKAGLCGRSAPLYKGYYPVCDPDDPGYSCCGAYGYCGTGDTYCKCPTCTDFANNPEKIVKEPVRPSVPVRWYFLNDPDGKRGRCGRDIPKINGEYPICNPDDDNAYCCSNGGYCGATSGHCDCKDCINFRKNPNYKF